jgi:hypothetical protein
MSARSIRAPEVEWQRWTKVAEGRGYTRSSWLRHLANQEADRLEAEGRRVEAAKAERSRLLAIKAGEYDLEAGEFDL